jgi:hypothetical protein
MYLKLDSRLAPPLKLKATRGRGNDKEDAGMTRVKVLSSAIIKLS